MITTRESINFQFSIIFGYSSPNDLIVGDVVGPGKLTRKKVQELAIDVVKFLRMYNAILRDYSGSELFSIEFALHNYDEKDSQLKIYPKSMILIPGKFKDCESLLLALKPETGYLDTHKSKESIDDISRLFFEVEEYIDHPELTPEDKEKISQKFATRFSVKLYGDLIEVIVDNTAPTITPSQADGSTVAPRCSNVQRGVAVLVDRVHCRSSIGLLQYPLNENGA